MKTKFNNEQKTRTNFPIYFKFSECVCVCVCVCSTDM